MTAALPSEVIRLWPGRPPTKLEGVAPELEFRGPLGVIPSSLMIRNVSEPTLSVFRPTKPNGIGVIVCPGGGWRILLWEHEGTEAVRWLTARGYTAFLLKYRVKGMPAAPAEYEAAMTELQAEVAQIRNGSKAPRTMSDIAPAEPVREARAAAADDARRAIGIVRERASEWGVDPHRLGMLGFSIGACLVVDVAVDPRAAPLAFIAPIYGGDTGRPVPANAPPLFAVVAQDDFLVYRVVEGLYSEWTEAGRSAELHVYRRGGHGFGLVKQGLPADQWLDRFNDWLTDLGFG